MKIKNSFGIKNKDLANFIGTDYKLESFLEKKNLQLKNKEIDLGDNTTIENYLKLNYGGNKYRLIETEVLEDLKKQLSEILNNGGKKYNKNLGNLEQKVDWFLGGNQELFLEDRRKEVLENISYFLENINYCLENNLEMVIISDSLFSKRNKIGKGLFIFFISIIIITSIFNSALNSIIDSLYSERAKIEKTKIDNLLYYIQNSSLLNYISFFLGLWILYKLFLIYTRIKEDKNL